MASLSDSESAGANSIGLGYLLDAAAWQDSLLQSYRSLHITIQSILLAISAGLLVAAVSIEDLWGSLVAVGVLVVIWLFQRFTATKFRAIVRSRGEDINFWHRELLFAEQSLPAQVRYFTKFKVYQKLHRTGSEHLATRFLSEEPLSVDEITQLVEKGLGHTRFAVDEQLFERLARIWWLFVMSSLLYSSYRILPLVVGSVW